MGYLEVTHKGKVKRYNVQTDVLPHVLDKAVDMILSQYPQDAHVDFIEGSYYGL